MMTWLVSVPLSGIGLIVLALLAVGLEGGHLIRLALKRRNPTTARAEGPDQLLSAVLGLLALLLGFTFSLALGRYEASRDQVVQESNAIGTTWLRAQLLTEPNRTAMRDLLRDYVEARLEWSDANAAIPDMARTAALQAKLWTVIGTAIRTDPSEQLSRALMDAMNSSFDMASARVAARIAHLPDRVLLTLLLFAIISVGLLGYTMAINGRVHRAATGVLLVLLSLAFVTILDIDRPRTGAIQVSQQPMLDLRGSIGAN